MFLAISGRRWLVKGIIFKLVMRLKKTVLYRKITNISRTESHNLNDSRLVVQLPLPNPLKPAVKSWMKM